MKGLFPQYEAQRKLDYRTVWKDAIFVFDSNVLLNLYRYQQGTRDELLSVLDELSDKIWIPFHVALEFQRNRLKVIATQGKKFSEVRKSIDKIKTTISSEAERLNLKKRHTLIDFDFLTTKFDELTSEFLIQLEASQKTQQKLNEPDSLKERIESLFENRVGPTPTDQKTIDDLFKIAEQRYKFKIPPGYMDSKKDEDAPDEFLHGGIIYKRKFGDYIIWTQLLSFAKSESKKEIIFVTDDAKEDWWLKFNIDGTKTIGPRPELIEESALSGGIEKFVMYNPENFLQYAKEFLKTEISEATIEDVRDTSKENSNEPTSIEQLLAQMKKIRASFSTWVLTWGGTEVPHDNLDLVINNNGNKHGYEVRPMIQDTSKFQTFIKNLTKRALSNLTNGEVSTFTFAFCLNSTEEIEELIRLLSQHKIHNMPEQVLLAIGMLDEGSSHFTCHVSGTYRQLVK
ncbi:PIN-like domain-containing protein [Pseudomonas yamanorum]|uniref:PIN-like domain-containing protein n=1 Tax=Pseudomonas yamanorum TaxID=515393 RepID=UPI003B9F6719